MRSKGVRLTVGEKIMLLLLHYTRYRGEFQAPMDITQDGIAKKLGIIRSAVPRAVGSLIDKGLLEEHLAHIEGLTRRRKVYTLTDGGIIEAKTLVNQLESYKIEVIDERGSREDSLGSLLNKNEMDLSVISDVLNRRVWNRIRDALKTEKEERTSYIHSLTPPKMFIGREMEIATLKDAIASQKRKITVVYGIAGVGKTTLSWKITEILGNEMNIFYLDLKEWTTLSYLMKELSIFLSKSGWDGLRSYYESTSEIDVEAVCDLLKTMPPEIPVLVIIDDLHRAPADIVIFLSSLKERMPFIKGMELIVLSRTRINFYDIRDVRITGLVGEEELLGFDRETSRKFLIERGFPKQDVDEIIQRTGGHPLALVLVEKEGFGIETSDFDEFLTVEIFSKLSKKECYLLGLLSLCRLQLRSDDLLGMDDADQHVIKNLTDHHLIFDTPGGFVIHDLIKDQAIEHLTSTDREKAHSELAEVFSDRLTSSGFYQDILDDVTPTPFAMEDEGGLGPIELWVSECIHHLLGSKKPVEAIETLLRAQLQIPSKDLYTEHATLIANKLPGNLERDPSIMKEVMLGGLHEIRDESEQALERYRAVSAYKDGEDLAGSLIRACRLWVPHMEEKVEGPKKALETLKNIDEEIIPRQLKYYFMINKASLYYKSGDHKGAYKIYNRFLSDLTGNEELPLHLRNSIEEAVKEAKKGSIQGAMDRFQKMMELIQANRTTLKESMPYVDVDHHLLNAIYVAYYGNQ